MKRTALIAYASDFVSFLLDSNIGDKINKIILFGSVARGDFDDESDIDLFIDTGYKIEKEVENILRMFGSSKSYETWKLKGIKNEISVKTGMLEKWSLRREVISSGIMLYGKYNEMPEKAKYYLLINMNIKNLKTSAQVRVWRKLYGYKQKIGNKVYIGEGLIKKVGGKKLGKAVFIVPMESRKDILDLLNKNKAEYTVNEIWSDIL